MNFLRDTILKTTRKYEGRKYAKNLDESTVDYLTVEEALQININGSPFTITMRTPGDDEKLVRGLLHSEGILTDINYCPEIILAKNDKNSIITIADLNIPNEQLGSAYTNSRSLLSVSSCGICGKTELEDVTIMGNKIESNDRIDIDIIHHLFDSMSTQQLQFKQSGGSHAAVAFNKEGQMLCLMEDIGRHNAVDKVVGNLILTSKINNAYFLTVSGRISYEIVIKCFKARIPIIAAVSAPSSLAVDYAKELGITLFAFSRDKRTTCYANAQRIDHKNHNIKAS